MLHTVSTVDCLFFSPFTQTTAELVFGVLTARVKNTFHKLNVHAGEDSKTITTVSFIVKMSATLLCSKWAFPLCAAGITLIALLFFLFSLHCCSFSFHCTVVLSFFSSQAN